MKTNDIYKEFKKLDTTIKLMIFMETLIDENEDFFPKLNDLYIRYLKDKKSKLHTLNVMLCHSLSSKYLNLGKHEDYLSARDSILLYQHVPDEFIDKYIPKVSKEVMDKEIDFLKREKIYDICAKK